MTLKRTIFSSPIAFVANMAWAYVAYALCRIIYLAENWSVLGTNLSWASVWEMMQGAWMFDTSALLYTNALYALMMLVPLHYKERDGWQHAAKAVFIAVNALAICINLADSVYSQYTGRRTTATIFSEFSNEGNLGSIIGIELLNHWYLVVAAIALIYGLSKAYVLPVGKPWRRPFGLYYTIQTICLALFIPLCICGMRGGATTAVRPITISNANQYVDRPAEAALVLNTPFSLIRTLGKKPFVDPKYFDKETLDSLYSPVHNAAAATEVQESGEPANTPGSMQAGHSSELLSETSLLHSCTPERKNIVILIVESFGREYIGALNRHIPGYQGYTPFVDSLISQSLTWEYSYCNGRKSIDGMPSVLSSIPMFVEPFFLTPASTNALGGIARELGRDGYHTAFFHGAENGSMGFQAFARATGFQEYYGRTEYNEDERFGGDNDFDGTWAVWDEPFMQFYAHTMNDMKEPFLTAIFTASSHHPFAVPEEYTDTFPKGDKPIHQCIGYTDHALRRFFETASRQPWYKNTLFVLTADHPNQSSLPEYQTALGSFSVPIILFDPSGTLPAGIQLGIAQQIDIMPTLLGLLGHDKPYVAFGIDLLDTPAEETWAVSYQNDIYQLVKGNHLILFDGQATKAIYNFREDPLLQHDLSGNAPQPNLEQELKAITQSYMQRMNGNQLIIKEP